MEYVIRDGELYHYKYIKRERHNGKWRYWYEDDTSAATQLKRDNEALEERKKKAAEQKELDDFNYGVEAATNMHKAGVLDDLTDDVLDELGLDAVSVLYPKMSLKDYRKLDKEAKKTMVYAYYAVAAQRAGEDPVEYAKKDVAARKDIALRKEKMIHSDSDDGELCHHGTKGQKWGVRRYQNKDGSLTPAGKKRYTKSSSSVKSETKTKSEVSEPKKKSVKKMSDEELKKRIERLKLEKDVKDLESKTTSRGKAFVMDVLEASGKNIATQLTTYAMGTAVNAVAKKAGIKNGTKTVKDASGAEKIEKIFEDIVNPRKGQKDK